MITAYETNSEIEFLANDSYLISLIRNTQSAQAK